MRVVIAGGSGFIGRQLTRSLVGDGHAVVVLTRGADRRADAEGVRFVTWDGCTGGSWAEALDGADALVNLAGENIANGLWTKARRQRILESRLLAGQACLEAIEQVSRRPRVLLQASAVGYYGDRGDTVLEENAPAGTGFLADVAQHWEASTAAAESLGVRRVVLRTAVVLGRDGGALPRMLAAFRAYLGGPLGSGRQWFPWIHLDDVVGAIRWLMECPDVAGPFNLAAPGTVTQRTWAEALGMGLARPARLRMPATLVRLFLGTMGRELFLASARVLPRRLLEAGYAFRFPSLSDALADLLQPSTQHHHE